MGMRVKPHIKQQVITQMSLKQISAQCSLYTAQFQHTCTHMPRSTLARALRTKVARMGGKYACTYTCWSMHAPFKHACTLTLVGLPSELTFYPIRMSCFLPACTRNRERHARGDCLLITRGYARWSLLVHCDRCTPRRAPSSPRDLQEVRWLGAQPARPPPGAPTPSSQAVGICRISLCPLRLLKNGRGGPTWAHPSMEWFVLRQGHIGWGYRSAHASGARVCAVGICYRLPVH